MVLHKLTLGRVPLYRTSLLEFRCFYLLFIYTNTCDNNFILCDFKNAWQLICFKITPLTMASYVWIVWCQYYYGTVLPTHGIYQILLCTLTHELMWAYAAISTQWQMQLPGLVFYFFLLFLSSVPCTISTRKTKHKSHILRTTCFFFFTV